MTNAEIDKNFNAVMNEYYTYDLNVGYGTL